MSRPRIEDYGLIGDLRAAALVSYEGSIDWLCLPRFDSEAVFAALLGDERHGFWRLRPESSIVAWTRRYDGHNLILRTELTTPTGTVAITDFMPPLAPVQSLVRFVYGVAGEVAMENHVAPRFDYGQLPPRVLIRNRATTAVAGAHAVYLRSDSREGPPPLHERFTLRAGAMRWFTLSYQPSHLPPPAAIDPYAEERNTRTYFTQWARAFAPPSAHGEDVLRSLLTIKALTYEPTGGVIAAPTTSLPEELGGERNWDYRYCWLRDASMTLHALLRAGFLGEARAWRNWLVRVIGGDPAQMQIMYGISGERRLTEVSLPHLPGYGASRPVRIGNAAVSQLQLDVFGEIATSLYLDAKKTGRLSGAASEIFCELAASTAALWRSPDRSVWEVRGTPRHFTSSKLSAWVTFDRALRAHANFGLVGPTEDWRRLHSEIHEDICARAYDRDRNTFVQAYERRAVDASLLMLPITGFLPPDDPRILGTIAAIERELGHDGLLRRYIPDDDLEGVNGDEGAFVACSFWLVEALVILGRRDDADALFCRLLDLTNDLGLLAEEVHPTSGRFLGNFPQALSHLALVHAAYRLYGRDKHV